MKTSRLILTLVTAVTLTACGSTAGKYRPIVDGTTDTSYETDLAGCQSVSEQKRYTNDDVKTEAAAGAIAGAVAGAIDSGSEGALGGAIAGSVLGGGGRAWETRDERKQIIISCMKQRGHKVVG